MKKFMKRLAGVALTLAMMVTMLPTQSAYAAREAEKQETEEQIIWEHFDEDYYINHEANWDEEGFVLYNVIEPLVGSWDDGNVIITEDWDIILKRSNGGTIYSGLQTVIDYGTSTYIYNNPADAAFAATCTTKEAAEYDWPENRYYVYEPDEWMGSKYPDGQKITMFIETRNVIDNEYADYLVIGLGTVHDDIEFYGYTKGVDCWKVRYKDVNGKKVPLSEVLENYAKDYLGLNAPEPTPEPTATPVPSATPVPTESPKPTATPVPTVEPDVDTDAIGETSDGRPFYAGEEIYKVVKGDCLWSIARRYLGHGKFYPILFERNKSLIKKPELIYPGWEIIYPLNYKAD